jgi:predicted DNA-binding protein
MTLRTDRRSLPRTADTTSSGAPRKQYYTTKKQKNPTVGVAFRLETQLYNEVMACAKDLGLNFSAFVRCAIEAYMDNYHYDNDLLFMAESETQGNVTQTQTQEEPPVCPVIVASGVAAPEITALAVPESRVFGIEPGNVEASFPDPRSHLTVPPAQSSGQAISSLPQDLLEAFGVPVAPTASAASETHDANDTARDMTDHDCFGENYVTALAEALLDFDIDTDSDSEADSESFSESDYVEPEWEDEFPDLDDLEDFE